MNIINHKAPFKESLIAKFELEPLVRMGFGGWFPRKEHDTGVLALRVERRGALIAVDVAKCTDPVRNTFSHSKEKLFSPPYFNESFDMSACQGYYDVFTGNENPSASRMELVSNSSLSKINALRDKVERAIELMRAQIFTTGVVKLKNGDSIDYQRKAESMVVVSTDWSDKSAGIKADIKKGMTFLREQGLSTSTAVNAIMGGDAFENLMANTELQEELNNRRTDRGSINMPQFDGATGIAFHGQISSGDFILNLFTYNETYQETASGPFLRYLDSDTVVLLPNDFVGETAFAATPAMSGEGIYRVPVLMKGEYVVTDIIDELKVAWEVILRSSPLAIPFSVDRIYTIKTKK